jgi:hypothetical protein
MYEYSWGACHRIAKEIQVMEERDGEERVMASTTSAIPSREVESFES